MRDRDARSRGVQEGREELTIPQVRSKINKRKCWGGEEKSLTDRFTGTVVHTDLFRLTKERFGRPSHDRVGNRLEPDPV